MAQTVQMRSQPPKSGPGGILGAILGLGAAITAFIPGLQPVAIGLGAAALGSGFIPGTKGTQGGQAQQVLPQETNLPNQSQARPLGVGSQGLQKGIGLASSALNLGRSIDSMAVPPTRALATSPIGNPPIQTPPQGTGQSTVQAPSTPSVQGSGSNLAQLPKPQQLSGMQNFITQDLRTSITPQQFKQVLPTFLEAYYNIARGG